MDKNNTCSCSGSMLHYQLSIHNFQFRLPLPSPAFSGTGSKNSFSSRRHEKGDAQRLALVRYVFLGVRMHSVSYPSPTLPSGRKGDAQGLAFVLLILGYCSFFSAVKRQKLPSLPRFKERTQLPYRFQRDKLSV